MKVFSSRILALISIRKVEFYAPVLQNVLQGHNLKT